VPIESNGGTPDEEPQQKVLNTQKHNTKKMEFTDEMVRKQISPIASNSRFSFNE